MLSYQHIYHAGNFADVHKHIILTLLLDYLIQKERGVTYMETHAGRGRYRLDSKEAIKTGEASDGIEYVINKRILPRELLYFDVIRAVRKKYGRNIYPGSPLIASNVLRPIDQMHLMELHPREFNALRTNIKAKNIHIHRRDGYEGVLSLSPPNLRRGLVLIDPSFEIKNEYKQVVKFIKALTLKWPEAVIMLWYPVLKEGYYQDMLKELTELSLKDICHSEVKIPYPSVQRSMIATGVFVANCPFGLAERFQEIFDRFK